MEQPGRATGLVTEQVSAGGLGLRFVHARPEAARATVVLLPGRGEFVEKYAETVADLAARRFAVASLDWRGQGLSDRLLPARDPGHVEDYAGYLDDLRAALARVDALRLPGPYIMLAHSMGGQIGLRFLHDEPGRFAAAMMTAPMWGIRTAPVPIPVARLLAAAAVRLGRGRRYAPGQGPWQPARWRYEGNPLTGCPDRFALFGRLLSQRPELVIGGVTYGWLAASLRSIALTRRRGYLEAIATPVLVCQSGLDRVVCNRSQSELVRRLRHGRLELFADARHEIMIERPAVRERFLALLEAFLAEVLGDGWAGSTRMGEDRVLDAVAGDQA